KKCQLIVLQLEVQLETVYHAIEFGKKHGIEVLLNPAPALRELSVARIREQVGDDKVILGLSGGVDSSVTAMLLHRAIGKNLTCV
ncbi:hypothetical protein ONQ60_26015, partial [Salmonella enterica subsp. enterica serovar Virginia]|nr:hypothetical protein [Salmonella enterica subsp. enterica serovar Virginia]